LLVFFTAWFFATEWGPMLLPSRDLGPIVWIPLHFVANPILGPIFALLSIYLCLRANAWRTLACVLPWSALMIAATLINASGSDLIIQWMGISFRR
jgi:hypothetical protein